MKRALCLSVFLGVGCGGEVAPPAAAPSAPPPAVSVSAPAGALWREDVVKTVDAGLGRFLQHVEVEPKLDGGTFVGFRIVSLDPPEYWQGVDLKPGDVVLRVNSLPIERDSEAYAAFQTLKSAERVTVLFLRDGEQREFTLRILDRGAAAAPKARGSATAAGTKAPGGGPAPVDAAPAPRGLDPSSP